MSILAKLVDAGGSIEMGDVSGRTPLHAAAYSGTTNIHNHIKWL